MVRASDCALGQAPRRLRKKTAQFLEGLLRQKRKEVKKIIGDVPPCGVAAA